LFFVSSPRATRKARKKVKETHQCIHETISISYSTSFLPASSLGIIEITECLDLELDLWFPPPPPADGVDPAERGVGIEMGGGGGGGGAISKEGDVFEGDG